MPAAVSVYENTGWDLKTKQKKITVIQEKML